MKEEEKGREEGRRGRKKERRKGGREERRKGEREKTSNLMPSTI